MGLYLIIGLYRIIEFNRINWFSPHFFLHYRYYWMTKRNPIESFTPHPPSKREREREGGMPILKNLTWVLSNMGYIRSLTLFAFSLSSTPQCHNSHCYNTNGSHTTQPSLSQQKHPTHATNSATHTTCQSVPGILVLLACVNFGILVFQCCPIRILPI